MRYMSGGQYSVPDRVPRARTARRSSSSRSTRRRSRAGYAHIPGLKVVTPGTPSDAKGLLKSAIRDDNPVVLHRGRDAVQHQGRGARGRVRRPARQGRGEARGRATSRSSATRKMVRVALKAAEQLANEGIEAEVVDLRTIRPLDTEAILTSVRKTNRCVVVEEGWAFAGVGAQVVDYIQREVLRRARRAGPARHRRRRADALRQEPRDGREARPGEDRRGGQEGHVPRRLSAWQPRS